VALEISFVVLGVLLLAAATGAFAGWVVSRDREVSGPVVTPTAAESPPADLAALRAEVAALRAEARETLRHLAVVRYDAFGDMGGHLSWTVALLDDVGDGLVITSIHARSDSRTYAKNIAGWKCDQPLSPEEEDAVRTARPEA